MASKPSPPRLGRGLAALLGDLPAASTLAPDRQFRLLPIAQLAPNPFQPRQTFDPAGLASLSESLKATGVLQPILVRPAPDTPDHWQIIAGERRWRAAQMAGLHEVPCYIRPLTDSEVAASTLIENLQRQDLNPIEEAEAYRRLIDHFGLTQDEVGQAVGRSRVHISNMLRLLTLPAPVQAEISRGTLSAGHARTLVGRDDAISAARHIIDRQLSVRQAEHLQKSQTRPHEEAAPVAADTDALASRLTGALGIDVQIQPRRRGAWLILKCADLDQLDRLTTQLLGET